MTISSIHGITYRNGSPPSFSYRKTGEEKLDRRIPKKALVDVGVCLVKAYQEKHPHRPLWRRETDIFNKGNLVDEKC